MVEHEDRTQARIDGLLEVLREADADFRRSYARIFEVVAELDAERVGAVAEFGTAARLLAGMRAGNVARHPATQEQPPGIVSDRERVVACELPIDELAEHFTLYPDEQELLRNKTGATRLPVHRVPVGPRDQLDVPITGRRVAMQVRVSARPRSASGASARR